jgi:hypothetical protein
MTWPWGRENWINNLSPFHIGYRLSIGYGRWWKVEGWEVTEFLCGFRSHKLLLYFWFWYVNYLEFLVAPAGVVESSLEAPSSSADARVCSKNWFWFWFWGLKFCLELFWSPGVWLAGSCTDTSRSRCEDRTGGGLGLAPFVCVLLPFCRVAIMVNL